MQPKNIHDFFDRSVPVKLVECIADLLKYDPGSRLTARQCLEHPYLVEIMPVFSLAPLESTPFPRASQQLPAFTIQPP